MEINLNNQGKVKRVRSNATKRWTMIEERQLIEFLMENRDFEKPMAQAFYTRFLEESPMELEWKRVRSKVRNMRVNYNTAKQWEGSTGAGSIYGDTIKSTLTKMFSFFYEFDDIFGSTLQVPSIIEETLHSEAENFDILNIEYIPDAQDPMSNLSPDIQYLPDAQNLMSISNPTIEPIAQNSNRVSSMNNNSSVVNESLSEVECIPSTSRRGIYSRTALSDIMKVQTEALALRKRKLDEDKETKEKEIKLREREVAIKEKELELKEKLQIMELEMKERLAREELHLKYKT